MNVAKDSPVEWAGVGIVFTSADDGGMYAAVLKQLGSFLNGVKKLKTSQNRALTLAAKCKVFLGRHVGLSTIMFCSQMHQMVATLSDPLTRESAAWLAEAAPNPAEWSEKHTLTLYAFGLLRQGNAVRLLMPHSSSFLGFRCIETVKQLGEFIQAQDTIEWTQLETRELSKLPGPRSYKAGVRLASMYAYLGGNTFTTALEKQVTYYAAVQIFKVGVPGSGDFIAKHVVEVILNAVSHSTLPLRSFPEYLQTILDDYLADPDAIFGPGPSNLFECFFGPTWTMGQFENIRSRLNHLVAHMTCEYQTADTTSPIDVCVPCLTGPRLQSLVCKLKGAVDDYETANLTHPLSLTEKMSIYTESHGAAQARYAKKQRLA